MESNYSVRDSYSKLIKLFVVGIETIIVGALFYLYATLYHCNDVEMYIASPMVQVVMTLMLIYLICAYASGVVLYRRKVYVFEIVKRIMWGVSSFAIMSLLVLETGRYMNVWSSFYLMYLVSIYASIICFRLVLRAMIKKYRTKGGNRRYVVLVGSSRGMIDLYNELTEQKWAGFFVNGYFDFEPNDNMPAECKYLGTPEDVNSYLKENGSVHYLYCGLRDNYHSVIRSIISYCENHLVRFYSVPNLNNYLQNRVFVESVGDTFVLSLRPDPMSRLGNKIIKRTFDIVFSSIFLVAVFPFILIIVSIITKLTMPGPVFFRQKRNGLDDKEFYCLKFRSMKVNDDADKVQATKNDPRKTKWGNFMRKANIDELPQFINVLMGDMSIVGPRPHMLKHTEEYSQLIDKYMVRHLVKPGVTGWSQVTGFRGETKELEDMAGRIRGDIWYIEHWSFWLDLYIIYKTVANVIVGEEKAY